jgi:hypothetical protein
VPVRRCFRGLVDSAKEEAALAMGGTGVDGLESFEIACDDERRFERIDIVAEAGHDSREALSGYG